MSRLAKIRKLKRTRVIKTRQCILDLIKKRTASKSQDLIIDFTTTACVRPWVLDATYKSYSTNLKGIDFKKCTLYINVDPIGNTSQYSAEDVVAVAEKYFIFQADARSTPDQISFGFGKIWPRFLAFLLAFSSIFPPDWSGRSRWFRRFFFLRSSDGRSIARLARDYPRGKPIGW